MSVDCLYFVNWICSEEKRERGKIILFLKLQWQNENLSKFTCNWQISIIMAHSDNNKMNSEVQINNPCVERLQTEVRK